jgi:iron complex transport system ATP-binding protein
MSGDVSIASGLRFEVDGLSLRAGGDAGGRVLFKALGFSVNAGERWAVLGPNGAGKSSLLAAMAGVFPVALGRVSLQGQALAQWRPEALADWRAWCPQFWSDPFPATVAETAAIAMRRGAWWSAENGDAEAVASVLDELDLAAFAQADVRQLSGGERQRVAVATALLQGAPLLLLDEPVSHLDLAHQRLLLQALDRRSSKGQAVVASLHDINLAWDLATHAVLIDGRGNAQAGLRSQVMTPANLSTAFGVPIDQVEVCGQRRFWIGAPLSKAG